MRAVLMSIWGVSGQRSGFLGDKGGDSSLKLRDDGRAEAKGLEGSFRVQHRKDGPRRFLHAERVCLCAAKDG